MLLAGPTDRVLLTQAARAESVSVRTLRKDARRGRLALIRIGSRDYVSLVELKRYFSGAAQVVVAVALLLACTHLALSSPNLKGVSMSATRAVSPSEAHGRLLVRCRRLHNPDAPGVADFLIRKAADLLEETPSGMIRPESLNRAIHAIDMSIVETSKNQRGREERGVWGGAVRKDATTGGSATTNDVTNGGSPPAADAVWANDPDEQTQTLQDLSIAYIAQVASDSQVSSPFTSTETLTILEAAGEPPADQQFIVKLDGSYKSRLYRACKQVLADRTLMKAIGGPEATSFAGETSNSGTGDIAVTTPPRAVADATTIPVEGVRAPTGPGAVDALARAATSPTSPAGPAPSAPTAAADLGAGLDLTISAVAIAQAVADAQGYAAADPKVIQAITKALNTRGVVRLRKKAA